MDNRYPSVVSGPDTERKEEVCRDGSGKFLAGVSGNPNGRPKKTAQEIEALERIKTLTPRAVDVMKEILDNPKYPAVARVRVIEIILERALGKPEGAVKLLTAQQSVETTEARMQALISQIRIELPDDVS